MNNCKIEIYENKQWVDYTKYMVASFKFANLLDEQLDEGTISLVKVPNKAYFKPMTRIRVVTINSPKALYSQDMADKIRLESDLGFKLINGEYKSYDNRTTFAYDSNTKRITITSIKEFLLANDTSIENPVGSEKYNHEIYLIEQTKYLERFIGDNLTFTNALGTNRDLEGYIKDGFAYAETKDTEAPKQIQPFLKLTYPIDTIINLPTFDIIANFEYIEWKHYNKNNYNDNDNTGKIYTLTLTIKNNEGLIASQSIIKYFDSQKSQTWKYYKSIDPTSDDYFVEITDFDLTLKLEKNRTYELVYKLEQLIEGKPIYVGYMEYLFGVANNVLPLKKWSITDVINRIFDTIEPLEKGTKPRFRLQGVKYNEQGEIVRYGDNSFYEPNSQAEKYDKILSPEFVFSQMNLREMLSQVGGFIHAEPRIIEKIETDNDEYWQVGFDEYGSYQKSHISNKSYVSAGYKTNVNEYCTSLDSSAQNLVNMLDYAQGVTFEPFYCSDNSGKGISIRTENTTMRIAEDDSSYIPTTFKNYMFKGNNQVRITYIPGIGDGNWDITPYIFEKDDYSILDSFEGIYPNSKSYALYYTQGTQNIYGLFHKAKTPYDASKESYAIINIIEAVIGRKLDWGIVFGKPFENLVMAETLENLKKVRFSISYLPISNARIRTAKPYIISGLPSTIAYNQSANLIESSYYGENLKGVASRLGNIQKTYTYHLAFLSDIPKVGTLFDENYYISSVSTEILPLYIRCTIGLSKDFNRLSEYVGISSEKRMWEVSKTMSQERQSVYTEYLVLTRDAKDMHPAINKHWNSFFGAYMMNTLHDARETINLVEVVAKDKNVNDISTVCLPVISMAVGNSVMFTFSFQDNYSAGQKIESGGWSNYVSYADIYGRVYYFDMNFICGEPTFIKDNGFVAQNFPNADLDNDNIAEWLKPLSVKNYKYRKDSREYPQITYELCAVSKDESLIIGSAFMKNCILVNRKTLPEFAVYGFIDKELNKFDNEIDITNAVEIGKLTISNAKYILPENKTGQKFKSWAILTPPQTTVEQVEDEDGNTFEQVLLRGCELILGANGEYKSGEHIMLEVKGIREIYEI